MMKLTIILLAISALVSCKPLEKGKLSEPVKVKADFKVTLPEDSAGFDISRSEVLDMVVGQSKEKKRNKTTAKITRTSEHNFKVEAFTAPDTVYVPVEVTCPPSIINQTEPQIVEIMPWWSYVLIYGLLAISAYLSFRLWLSGKTINIKLPDGKV